MYICYNCNAEYHHKEHAEECCYEYKNDIQQLAFELSGDIFHYRHVHQWMKNLTAKADKLFHNTGCSDTAKRLWIGAVIRGEMNLADGIIQYWRKETPQPKDSDRKLIIING